MSQVQAVLQRAHELFPTKEGVHHNITFDSESTEAPGGSLELSLCVNGKWHSIWVTEDELDKGPVLVDEIKRDFIDEPEKPNEHLQKAIDALQDAFNRDPAAITALLDARVGCGSALADHPTMQVRAETPDGPPSVSALGLINGLVEAMSGGRIAVLQDELSNEIKGFQPYKKPSEQGAPVLP